MGIRSEDRGVPQAILSNDLNGAALETVKLSYAHKQSQIEKIELLHDGLNVNFAQTEKHNDLGNLVDLTQGANNPLQFIDAAVTPKLTIDNSEYSGPFTYLVNM